MNNQQLIDLVLLIGLSLPVGYGLTRIEYSAWAKKNQGQFFALFLLLIAGSMFLAERFLPGSFMAPVLGFVLGGQFANNLRRRKERKLRLATEASQTEELRSRVAGALSARKDKSEVATVEITDLTSAAVDASIKACLEQGLTVITEENHSAKTRSLKISG